MIDDPKASEKIEVGLAFEALRNFLEAFHNRGAFPDALPWLLYSALLPGKTRMPMDQAQWHDFLAAVEKAKSGEMMKGLFDQ